MPVQPADSGGLQALVTTLFINIDTGRLGAHRDERCDAQRTMIGHTYSNGAHHFSRGAPFLWVPLVYVGD